VYSREYVYVVGKEIYVVGLGRKYICSRAGKEIYM
jgi:hypothetical protein